MRRIVLTSAFVFVVGGLVLNVGAAPVGCAGRECDAGITDTGEAFYSPTNAKKKAIENCENQCTDSLCQHYADTVWWDVYPCRQWDKAGGGYCTVIDLWWTQPYGSDGPTVWHAIADGTCDCYPREEEENWPAAAGRRVVGKTYTSPVITPITDFFKRLFGRGK